MTTNSLALFADLSPALQTAGKEMFAAIEAGQVPLLIGMPVDGAFALARRYASWLGPTKPFRAPHFSVSLSGLLGGRRRHHQSEIHEAYGGVLFLDDVAEFSGPATSGVAKVYREGVAQIFEDQKWRDEPVDFQLILASAPCPCGCFSNPERVCICSAKEVERYQERAIAPFLDVRVIRY